mgnify:CR=1 FL=1
MYKSYRRGGVILAALIALIASPGLLAEEEESKIWSDTADFGLVMTGGNSEVLSFGFKNTRNNNHGLQLH